MDVSQYYVTTLVKALTKIGPIVGFIVIGYFIFVKLPFFFFLRNMGINKKKFELVNRDEDFQKDYTKEQYEDFQRRMKLLRDKKEEPKKEEKKKEEPKQEQKKKTEQKKEAPKKPRPKEMSPEEVFELSPNQVFTKEELRKKYHALLRQNHPDKVASLGSDFKKLAEKKTKDINLAYDKLKKKAA